MLASLQATYHAADPRIWLDLPDKLLAWFSRERPRIEAEQDYRAYLVAAVAHPECDPKFREQVVASWLRAIQGSEVDPVTRRRPDGSWDISTGRELRRYFVTVGGFKAQEVD